MHILEERFKMSKKKIPFLEARKKQITLKLEKRK